jgi:dUTP pyrophosphatase
MKIKVKRLNKKARLPTYATAGDAGMDLYTVDEVTVKRGERKQIPTGLAFEIPDGYVGLVWDKSGLAVKNGLTTLAGVVDSGYRGGIILCVFNSSAEDYTFKAGDKVAQMLIQPVVQAKLEEVAELAGSERGDGRFGSTGQ